MNNPNRIQRRQLYIKPTFQRKMMILMILVAAIAANLVGGLCYGLITFTLEDELLLQSGMAAASQIPVLKQQIFAYIFPKVLLAEVVTLGVLFFLALRITHHIAGPVYRLEKNLKEMALGNFEMKTTFRYRDEFSELAEATNELSDVLVNRMSEIRKNTEALMNTDVSPEQKKALQKILELSETRARPESGFEAGYEPSASQEEA